MLGMLGGVLNVLDALTTAKWEQLESIAFWILVGFKPSNTGILEPVIWFSDSVKSPHIALDGGVGGVFVALGLLLFMTYKHNLNSCVFGSDLTDYENFLQVVEREFLRI